MKQRTDLHGQVLSRALTFAKFLLASILAIALTGCGGAGGLLSNPRVSDADNDQVITIGDSIFALSGELQDFLEDRAGESFRRRGRGGTPAADRRSARE